jgi:hypothetical protein
VGWESVESWWGSEQDQEGFLSWSLEPTQPPFEWVRGISPKGIRREGREPDNSPTPCANVKV